LVFDLLGYFAPEQFHLIQTSLLGQFLALIEIVGDYTPQADFRAGKAL
jgi:hypothetical protein